MYKEIIFDFMPLKIWNTNKIVKHQTLVSLVVFIKFIYSEKATKIGEISTLLLSYVVPVKSKVELSPIFVAFSEYIGEMFLT